MTVFFADGMLCCCSIATIFLLVLLVVLDIVGTILLWIDSPDRKQGKRKKDVSH
jgi:regulatory protein YycH of two-component signal transduction system YycFG